MPSRLLAGCAGAVIAIGVYAVTAASSESASAFKAMSPFGSGNLRVVVPSPPADSTPARLVIPSIGVDAAIEARGLDSNRNLATPRDFRHVAWYDLGPRPGDPGNAILNGHVNWWTGDAVFTHLTKLRKGDLVRVVRTDGAVVTFEVTARQTVDANARIASLFAPSTSATLTLITCSGAWNPLTQSDTQRLLVSATLV